MKYVLGFLFTGGDRGGVGLIRKTKPDWQKGKLNGIGGKVKANEPTRHAMQREFYEETGVFIAAGVWTFVTCITFPNGDTMDVFAHHEVGQAPVLLKLTDEWPCYYDVRTLPRRQDTMDNLCWLIPMADWALECQRRGVPQPLDLSLEIK